MCPVMWELRHFEAMEGVDKDGAGGSQGVVGGGAVPVRVCGRGGGVH
jgi:hypothetical protein